MSAAALAAGALAAPLAFNPAAAAPGVVSLYTSGLDNPRGLKFGPDGDLYVAEGGTGGSTPPPNDPDCFVPPPVGPYLGSPEGSRISKIDSFGNVKTVADGFPSSQTSADTGNLVSGVADIAFIGDTLYAILAGAGCSHGVPSVPNSVVRVNSDGSWNVIADLSAYQRAHPVAHPEVIADGLILPTGMTFGPDGNLYVSNVGFGPYPPMGLGQVLKIELVD